MLTGALVLVSVAGAADVADGAGWWFDSVKLCCLSADTVTVDEATVMPAGMLTAGGYLNISDAGGQPGDGIGVLIVIAISGAAWA